MSKTRTALAVAIPCLLLHFACSGRYEVGYEPGEESAGSPSWFGSAGRRAGASGAPNMMTAGAPSHGGAPGTHDPEQAFCRSDVPTQVPEAMPEPAEVWRRLSTFLLDEFVEPDEPLPAVATEGWIRSTTQRLLAVGEGRVFSSWLESWPVPAGVAQEYGAALGHPNGRISALLAEEDADGDGRVGILTDERVLRAHPSISDRGRLVVENLYCQRIPDHPPSLGGVPEVPGMSRRQELEANMQVPCVACHVLMDPYGFSLEWFGPDGAWRETDDGVPIDSSGQVTTPLGAQLNFMSILDLSARMAESCEVYRCIARQLFLRALERAHGLDVFQAEMYLSSTTALETAAAHFYSSGGSTRELIEAIVLSPEFLAGIGLHRTP